MEINLLTYYINKQASVVILANCCIDYILYVNTMKMIPYMKQCKSQKVKKQADMERC